MHEELNSFAIVPSMNELDIQYLVPYMETFSDVDSSARVVYSNEIDSIAIVEPVRTDLESWSYIPYKSDLDSVGWIAYFTELDLNYQLVQAPIYELPIALNNDVYLREARPTINYGQAETLVVGSILEGEFKTLIQFNINDYLNLVDEEVTEAVLGLYLQGSAYINHDLIIDVYEIKTAWQENNVTWQSFLEYEINPNPIMNFTPSQVHIQLNIREYIKQLKTRGVNTVNLLLKARNVDGNSVTYIHSAESTVTELKPYVNIKYQSSVWTAFGDDIELNSSARVLRKSNKDLNSKATPRFNPNVDLHSTVLIGKWSQTDLPSIVNVPGYKNTDIDSSVIVNHTIDLNSGALIGKWKWNDIDSFAKAYHPYVDVESSAMILNYKDLESTATPKVTGWKDLESSVEVTNPIYFEDSDLNSSAVVFIRSDLEAQAVVRQTVHIDLDGTVIPRIESKTDIDADVNIYQISDLFGEVQIRHSADKDLFGEAISRITDYIDIDSEVFIRQLIDLLSEAKIRRAWEKDLLGKVIPRITDYIDTLSTADIYQFIELLSSAIVRQFGDKDLESLVFILQKIDLDSTATIRASLDMLSLLIIRQFGLNDIESEGIVRQFDVAEIDTSVEVVRTSMINGYAEVRRTDRMNLDCIAEVITDARQWVPNVHAPNIFTFGDAKLPRRWKKEMFIP